MVIGYYTDNSISKGVMQAFADNGIEIKHIKDFTRYSHTNKELPIFYGMLRGTGMALRWCQSMGYPFYYLDNGYFDAVYMDHNKVKDMHGTYRMVKGDMIERYPGTPHLTARLPLRVLALPPTPYAAFMHDTTPEDWSIFCKALVNRTGDQVTVRDKGDKTPLSEALRDFDVVLTFNSMGVMEAARQGLAVYDTHGVFRNVDLFETYLPFYDYDALRDYYNDKQFTLAEIREGKWRKN